MGDDWIEQYHKKKREDQAEKGGPGSGHWGHAGRPGKRGGSLPGDVAVSIRTGRTAASNAAMKRALNTKGRWETKDDPDFSFIYAAVRGNGPLAEEGELKADEFDIIKAMDQIRGAKRHAQAFIKENGDLLEAIDRDGSWMRQHPDRKISTNIIFTNDQKDAGMGTASTGGFKVFYCPYDASIDHWTGAEGYVPKMGWGIDPIYVTMHELHHAYGSSTEFDLLSDVMGVSYHLSLGNKLNPKEVRYTARSWFTCGMWRASGSLKNHIKKNRKAFKWLYDNHRDYAEQFLTEWSNADELRKKVKRW